MLPKPFESLISKGIASVVRSVISLYQHECFKEIFTFTNLLQQPCSAFQTFSEYKLADVIYTHISNIFDRVWNRLLIYKLKRLGFSWNIVDWFSSYLTGRSQAVLFNSTVSRDIFLFSGVSQGSQQDPLLFALFVNHRSICLNSSLKF